MRLLIAAALPLLITSFARSQQSDTTAIDSLVNLTMKRFDVPGIALAVVKEGRVVLEKGYGVRELGRPDKVDEHTLFGIASNTKAFTATAIGLLVEEGKLAWNEPVITYLSAFRLSDPYVTSELTVRDLLVHRSGLGLGCGDLLLWPGSTYDRKEIVRRLRYLPLATSFRSAYAYDNVLYLVAGELIEAVSGIGWEEFVRTRILDRVGMDETVESCRFPRTGNVASTHARVESAVRAIPPDTSTNANPAGGIHASAHDIARWMITQLDSGRCPDGTRLYRPSMARELWSVVTPLSPADPPRGLEPSRASFFGYGLGFFIRDFRGIKSVYHDGGLPGYVSRVFLLPAKGIGVAVLTNQEATAAFKALVSAIADRCLGEQGFDWIGAVGRAQDRLDSLARTNDRERLAQRDVESRPPLPLERYAGIYRDRWYGDVRVLLKGRRLEMQFSRSPMLSGTLEHFQYDTFIVRWASREMNADAFVTFDLNPDGSIERVRMKPVSATTDFSYDFQDLDLRPAASTAR
jgi:CubicO group peptidase (beta-lactamase class C family)